MMSTTPDAAESAGAPTSCDPVTDLIDAHTGNRGHRGGLFPFANAPRPWRSINVATVFTVTSVPSQASCAWPRNPRRRHRTRRRPSRPWCPVPAVRQTLAKARRQGCCSSQELVVLVPLGDLKAQGLELGAFIQGQFPGRSAGPGGSYGGDPLAQRREPTPSSRATSAMMRLRSRLPGDPPAMVTSSRAGRVPLHRVPTQRT